MSAHTELEGIAERPETVERKKTPPRFVLTGLVASYAIALAPIVVAYAIIKGYV